MLTTGRFPSFEVIAFDADDTLWDCQSHFAHVERHLCRLMAPWCDAETAASRLFETERGNMALLGYGSKAFTISVLETALAITHGEAPTALLAELLAMGKAVSDMPATPLPGVCDTLRWVRDCGREAGHAPRMVVFTKGEPLEQENKLERSGLKPFFDDMEIVSTKGEREFLNLCDRLHIQPEEMLMVGNSFKSDIAPALRIGAYAVHIPFHVVWQLEHSEEFDHERLVRLDRFEELRNLL